MSFTDTQLMLHWADEHPIYAPSRGILLSSQIHLLKYELTDLVQSKFVDIWQEGKVIEEEYYSSVKMIILKIIYRLHLDV